MLVDLIRADDFLLFQGFGIGFTILVRLSIVNYMVYRAYRSLVTFLGHGQNASIV